MLAQSEEDVKPGFAQRLRATRRNMALTQDELARAVGVSTRAYQGWERDGIVPQPKNLRRLSEITGAPVAWLLDGEHA